MTERARAADYGSIRVESTVERKLPTLPCFVVVPNSVLRSWELSATTIVDIRINGAPIGRRSLKPWVERGVWFFDLTKTHLLELGVDRGDCVSVELVRADPSPPQEILDLLLSDASARSHWSSLSPARRRILSGHVRSAKRADTRARRARAALCLMADE